MMMVEGIVMRHYISGTSIQVDPENIKVVLTFPTPRTPTKVCSFLGYTSYYHRFIEKNFNDRSTTICFDKKC